MSIMQRMKGTVQKLQDMHDCRVREAEERAKRKVAEARTKTEKEKAKLQLQREKMALKREFYEAKIATQKAKLATERARKEAGDLTIGERLKKVGQEFYRGKPRKTISRKRKKSAKR